MGKKINFFKISYRLKFLINSTNQHGVHSPFVFDFVTKGLYSKKEKKQTLNNYSELNYLSKKEKKIVSKIIKYFLIKKIYLKSTKTLNKGHNVLFINDLKNLKTHIFLNFNKDEFIILHGIHDNKSNHEIWSEIIKNESATVTIDLFYFGLLFFRNGQVKEHFKIRV